MWYKERRQQDEARRKREQEARYERQLQFEASQEKLRKEQEVHSIKHMFSRFVSDLNSGSLCKLT